MTLRTAEDTPGSSLTQAGTGQPLILHRACGWGDPGQHFKDPDNQSRARHLGVESRILPVSPSLH